MTASNSEIPEKSIIDSIRDGIWSGSPDVSHIDSVNPAFEKLWGCTIAELRESSQALLDGIHPDDRDRVRAVIGEHLDDEWAVQCRVVRPDGSQRRIEAHGFRPVDGRRSGICRDITDEFDRQRQLEETLKLLRATNRLARVGGWEHDLETSEGSFSEEVSNIYELPPGEVPSLEDGTDFYHPDDREIIGAAVQDAVENGVPYDLELRLQTAKGNLKHVRTQCRPEIVDGRTVKLWGTLQDITARKQAETERSRMSRLISEMSQLTKTGVWEYVLETRAVTFSDELSRIFEIPEDEPPPPFEDQLNLYDPEDHAAIQETLRRAINHGEPYDLELRVITAKGNHRWVHTIGRPEVVDGKTVGLWGSMQDITKQKLAQAELTRAADLVSEMSRLSKTGGWEYIPATRAITFSDELNRIFEIPDGEPPPYANAVSLYDPEDQPVIWKAFQSAIKHGEPYDLELRVITMNGNRRWVHTIGRPEVVNGKTVRLWGSLQDITERKLAETKLSRSEIRRRTVLDAAPDSIVLLDQAGIVEEWNHAAEIMFGYSAEEAIGSPVADLIIPEQYRQAHTDGLAEFARTGVGKVFGSTVEVDALRADGSTVPVELAIQGSEDSGQTFSIGILRDRSDRVESERQMLLVFEQLVGAMARTVENRDPYTAGHQMRVRDLSVAIAERLGLSPDEIRGVTYGAMIHDVGKMAVPAEILNRPGKLTSLEFEMIKSHPVVGAEIISGVAFPWPVGSVVLQHHERLDGSGYPYGLKAGEIANEAQIVAVADVVEAMSSHRPYRAALGIDAALAEISKGRGVLFDTDAVDACIGLFRDDRFEFRS